MRIRNTKNRQGITLVFVVSMIVLFLLMGTSFVIISNDYFKASRKRSQAKINDKGAPSLVHRSFLNIVRGPDLTNFDSPLRGIDLLSDQYGYGYKATIQTAEAVNAGRLQLIRIQLNETSTTNKAAADQLLDNGQNLLGLRSILADAEGTGLDIVGGIPMGGQFQNYSVPHPDPTKVIAPELDIPGYFGGQVLTFVSGPAKGVSARIVDYSVTIDTSGATPVALRWFVIVPEKVPDGTITPFDSAAKIATLGDIRDGGGNLISSPSQIVINGKPFSGFGSGVAANYVASPDDAFRPNHARFDLANGMPWTDAFFADYAVLPNSVNEPYDAFDHDNVHLAQNDPADQQASYNPIQMAPANYGANAAVEQNRYSFRPVFQLDGSGNPALNNTANQFFPNVIGGGGIPFPLDTRPLDVDNDFDGVADSVWIDMGHQIITQRDGRRVKPLVAAMVIDLDSRLNINAHGTFADAQANATLAASGFMTFTSLLGVDSATPANSFNMPRGLGWGPPEVSLTPVLNDYRPLLIGLPTPSGAEPFTTVPRLPGRYGIDRFPGNSFFDTAAQFRFSDHPGFGTVGGSFKGRPMDIHGRFATGFPSAYEPHTIPDPANPGSTINVDVPYGMPIIDIATSTWPPEGPYSNSDPANPYPGFGTEIYNSPYEVSLYQGTRRGDDTLFTPDELEAMLRAYDFDSELLASRLLDFGVPKTKGNLITTDSYEVPALPPTLFRVRNPISGATETVAETIPQRVYNILKANNAGAQHNTLFAQMRGGEPAAPGAKIRSLLSHEVLRGLPMNVNRIFGDGADNDADGITDEHWNSNQLSENESDFETVPLTAIGLDHDNDGAVDIEDRFSRQNFARHLYVLTWLTTSPGPEATAPFNPRIADFNGDGNNNDNDMAFLAQWCANVVDFRDADSICTPFKYDKNPWDGWDELPYLESGDIEPYDITDTDVGVVWGLERPELLITEALATHERRYTDSDGDMTWESEYVPKASVFVELYNPWATSVNTESAAAEIYSGGGIDLGRHTNQLSGGADEDPVWRLVFTEERDDPATDADSRRVYFREPSTSVEALDDDNYYYPTSTYGVIGPNGYAVIGSSGIETDAGDYRTTFGRRTDADELSDLKLDETRSITLVPDVGVELVDGTDGANMTTESRECVVVPIDIRGRGADYEERSLGITDPLNGYDPTGVLTTPIDPNGDGNTTDGDGWEYLAPLTNTADPLTSPVHTDGMSHGERYVQLQRLANPEAPYDQDTNPYLTVDVAPVDIFSFNGLAQTNDDVAGDGALDFDTHERGETQNGVLGAWDDLFDGMGVMENDRVLWPEENLRTGMVDVAPINTDLHFLSQEFDESFGVMNETYRGLNALVARKPFPWLMWNNRPYVSQYELVNVPMFRSREVLNNYSANNGDHLVQFYNSTLKRVFGFLEVPPRFLASEVGFQATAFNGDSPSITSASVFNAPYNYTSRYRYPGKINVNTISADQDAVWNQGMMRNWGVGYGVLTNVRDDDGLGYSEDPIRPDGVAAIDLPRAIVDPVTLDSAPANQNDDGSIMRTNAGGNNAHFFRTSALPHDNTARNNAFYGAPVTKLANISTNRSSVYAVWITVGYFEVDEQGRVGAEVGADTGEVTRNRGFYIFDRSIPMAFEPGKNHNVERGILVQSIIE